MAGSDGPPDFALWPAVNHGGDYRRYRRPCLRVKGDVIETYRSVEEAAAEDCRPAWTMLRNGSNLGIVTGRGGRGLTGA